MFMKSKVTAERTPRSRTKRHVEMGEGMNGTLEPLFLRYSEKRFPTSLVGGQGGRWSQRL